jgi:hypothetical protein
MGPEWSREKFLPVEMLARQCPKIARFCRDTSLIV